MSETFELYRCTECEKMSVSIGWLHAHVEKHRGYTPLRIQVPFTRTAPGDFDALMEFTEVIRVTEYELVDEPRLAEDPGLLARVLPGGETDV